LDSSTAHHQSGAGSVACFGQSTSITNRTILGLNASAAAVPSRRGMVGRLYAEKWASHSNWVRHASEIGPYVAGLPCGYFGYEVASRSKTGIIGSKAIRATTR
jgi:hypothetical protein